MKDKNVLSRIMAVYGGIKFCQKFIPSDESLPEEMRNRMIMILAEQEKIIERILSELPPDKDESIYLEVFKHCQKDVYIVI